MQYFTLLIFLLPLLAYTQPQISATAYTEGSYSHVVAVESPTPTNASLIEIKAVHIEGEIDTSTIDAEAEASVFIAYDPNYPTADHVGFYYAGIEEAGSYNVNQTTGVASLHIAAAAVEFVARFYTVFAYKDRNGVAGFQYVLGQPFGCASAPNTSDCIYGAKNLNALDWAPISIQSYKCPTSYNQTQCQVRVLTIQTVANSLPTITITLTHVSQPVVVNGVSLGPDNAELVLAVSWGDYTGVPSDAKLGLVAATAGKAGAGALSVSVDATGRQVVYFAAGLDGKQTGFSWVKTVKVQPSAVASVSQTVNVVVDAFTGADLVASWVENPCVPVTGETTCPLFWLTAAVEEWAVFGWEVQIFLFSFDYEQPGYVEWDPGMGSSSLYTEPNSPTSAGTTMGPLLWLTVFVLLWWRM